MRIAKTAKTVLSCAALIGIFILLTTEPVFAQALESRITQTIEAVTRLVNILIVGFIVWSGFLIAKGDESGFGRLIYGVIGLIVANAAYLIINYFR